MKRDLTISLNDLDKVKAWRHALQNVTIARKELERLIKVEQEAETALAKHILPEDHKDGESVCLWFGDSLINARASRCYTTDPYNYSCGIQRYGESLKKLELTGE